MIWVRRMEYLLGRSFWIYFHLLPLSICDLKRISSYYSVHDYFERLGSRWNFHLPITSKKYLSRSCFEVLEKLWSTFLIHVSILRHLKSAFSRTLCLIKSSSCVMTRSTCWVQGFRSCIGLSFVLFSPVYVSL